MEYGLRHLQKLYYRGQNAVLILILLEYGLRLNNNYCLLPNEIVLILILLEYGLRLHEEGQGGAPVLGLNPYSIGIWSATIHSVCLVAYNGMS